MAALSVSAVAGDSDIVKYYCCTFCKNERSIEVDADFYCKTCLKYFCKKCIHYHRQHGWWFYTKSPYGKDKIMKWPLSKKMENSLFTCDIHKVEQLTMYCPDHSQLCCSRCAELNHRLCLQVTPLPQASKGKSTDFKDLSFRTQNCLSQMNQFQTYQEGRIMSLKVSYNEYEKLILDEFRRNIISFLLQCENSTVNETNENLEYTYIREIIRSSLVDFEKSNLKEKKQKLTLKLAPLIRGNNTCIRLHNQLFQLYVAIQKVHDRPELLFIASKKCQEKIDQFEQYLHENCSNKFIVNGKSEYNVRISSESSTCLITAINVLPNGQILVADSNNDKVKLLNQQYKVVSHCGMAAYPWDMCIITPSEVAVAVDTYNTREVQFITVTQSQLVPGRKFQLQHECRGIAYHQLDLFIASGKVLYKYSLRGKQVCRLYQDVSVWKCAVSPTGDKLYIINQKQHKLLTLTRNGTLLATFTDPALEWSDGLDVTPAGQVLVCGWLSHNILQVDREGRTKLATLATWWRDGVSYPRSVVYSSSTSSIIVGRDGDKIMVFKVE